MKNFLILLIFCILINHSISLAGDSTPDTLFVASWNLENLFDTVDDPGKIDEEFLPGSKKDWTNERLTKKLSNLARVIHAMNNNNGPDILGVCEVEHESLLKDMISKYLTDINYQIAYVESPDVRGIDTLSNKSFPPFVTIEVKPPKQTIFAPNFSAIFTASIL